MTIRIDVHKNMYWVILLTVFAMGMSNAIKIDDRELSIDEAIVKAQNGSDSLSMDPDSVLVELDILYKVDTYVKLRMDQEEAEKAESNGRMKRKAIIPESEYRWTNRVVPYEISSSDFSPRDRRIIMDAIKEYHKYTCLRLVPARRSDRNKIRFQNGGGCSSYVGMIGGAQPVRLARGCRYKGIVIHEIGHAIGFQHEQTRPDRDGYVTIHKRNIKSGRAYNFQRYTRKQVSSYGVPYDYTSVMHYGQFAFSKNGKPTIIAKNQKYQKLMGNREGLSFRDIKLANLMYHCAANSGCRERRCPRNGFQGKDCRCWCPTNNRRNPIRACDVASIDPTVKPVVDQSSKTCKDKKDICSSWKKFCEEDVLKPYLMKNCKKSCGYCQKNE